ncbi:hypothetical protein, partial [Fischerella thermalis]|uniref:hypothetical protein n=1 Tax=Fischerella thermalis TaxID=372787 RepID=UPI001CA4EC54
RMHTDGFCVGCLSFHLCPSVCICGRFENMISVLYSIHISRTLMLSALKVELIFSGLCLFHRRNKLPKLCL